MPDIHEKTETRRLPLVNAKAKQPLPALRAGMPTVDSNEAIIGDAAKRIKMAGIHPSLVVPEAEAVNT